MFSIRSTLISAFIFNVSVQAMPKPDNMPTSLNSPQASAIKAEYTSSASSEVPSSSSAAPAPAPVDPNKNNDLIAQLHSLPTVIKRWQRLLTVDGESLLAADEIRKTTVFDFNNATPAPGSQGGATKAANIDTFPILTDLGISTTVGFLNPCGINTPHVHPRAAEFLTVVEGTLDFGYILENGLVKSGSAEVSSRLDKFQGTVFPMGSIHYQINPTCEPAIFVATLNSEDPGTNQVAQGFFGLNGDVVNATLGFPKTQDGKNIETFRQSIPANLAQAVDTCLEACSGQ